MHDYRIYCTGRRQAAIPLPQQVTTGEEAQRLLVVLTEQLGWGFHSDTRCDGHINLRTNEPSYTPDRAAVRDELLDQAFDLIGDDVYDLSRDVVYTMPRIRYDDVKDSLVYAVSGDVIDTSPGLIPFKEAKAQIASE